MPLRDDILNPIPGANPGGENLRYAPVYDKIKEARRQDDEGPMGDWQRERKVADWAVVIKLAGEAIATKSKDLQLAVWLTEALLHKEGFVGLQSGINLCKGIIEAFWDGMYPEVDDGDSEMRAAPLEWLGAHYLEVPIKRVALTKSGLHLLDYHKAKKLGRAADVESDYEKSEAFNAAVAAGELTLDDWDKAFNSTSKDFYRTRTEEIDIILQTLDELQPVSEEKFGEFAPSFSKLRSILEEVRHQANQFLKLKLEADPDEPAEPAYTEEETPAEETEVSEYAAESVSYSGAAAAPARAKARPKGPLAAEPADREDAIARVASAARFWRTEDPYSPAPYLMLRGMRWGELRAAESLDPYTFEAPDSETRTSLKRLLTEGSYAEAIEIAETAMATTAGRAWIDLQRYVVTAAENLGYTAIAEAIKAELAALLKTFPDLQTSTLMDDTPCANHETVEWLKGFIGAEPASAAPMPMWQPSYEETEAETPSDEGTEKAPDPFDLAMEAASSGRQQEAFEILLREAAHQNSGRGRFQRRLQLAQVCLSTGAESIAFPILQELAGTIEKHQLEEWESPEMVAHAFALLYRCMTSDGVPEEQKRTLYSKICRLDPVQALAQSR